MPAESDPPNSFAPLTITECVQLACSLEVTAPKPGNVHRGSDFEDLCFADFVASGAMISTVLGGVSKLSLGETILAAVRQTRSVVSTNTNLGIILLLAPLCRIDRTRRLEDGIDAVLESLSPSDAHDVYGAINEAIPGGMGKVDEHDLSDQPPADLLEAMRLAKDRDAIARQYVTGFADLFRMKREYLGAAISAGLGIIDAVVWTHVSIMADYPDSLILRKRGEQEAAQASAMAGAALNAADREGANIRLTKAYYQLVDDLDFWLRAHPGRNPGTTADLVTATIFCALREQEIQRPFTW